MVVTSTTGEFHPLDAYQHTVRDDEDVDRVLSRIRDQIVAARQS